MKRLLAFTTVLGIILAIASCGSKGNTLMENASPGTSALALYVYDGETATRGFIFDSAVENDILHNLASVSVKEAPDWTPDQITLPIYGLEISDTEGWTIHAAWSNGYWITQDGIAYHFDYDFEALESDYEWTSKDTWPSISIMPCAYYLTKDSSGWNNAILSPSKEFSAPENISAELTSQTEETLSIALTNTGTEEWCYGEYYYLDVLLDGTWYSVPTTPGNWAFTDIGIILPARKTQNKTYNLTMYGDLPAGQYRLIASQCVPIEFTIE